MFDEYRLYDIIEVKEDRNGAGRHFIITPDESWEEHAQLISCLDFLSAHNSHWPSQGYLILYINRSISFIYLFAFILTHSSSSTKVLQETWIAGYLTQCGIDRPR